MSDKKPNRITAEGLARFFGVEDNHFEPNLSAAVDAAMTPKSKAPTDP